MWMWFEKFQKWFSDGLFFMQTFQIVASYHIHSQYKNIQQIYLHAVQDLHAFSCVVVVGCCFDFLFPIYNRFVAFAQPAVIQCCKTDFICFRFSIKFSRMNQMNAKEKKKDAKIILSSPSLPFSIFFSLKLCFEKEQ